MTGEPAQSEAWITFAGGIDNQACVRLFNQFTLAVQHKFARLHLLIQSAGGVVGDGIALHNLLLRLPIEVVTYNIGAVESIAVLPYLAGKVRRVSKTATFMLHRTAPLMTERATAERLRARAEDSDIYDNNVEEILKAFLVKMPETKWAIHQTRELLISAQDALEFGMAHEISDFTPAPGAPLVSV
jgi:ATP-dependent Clp protease protease subunit